MSEESQNSSQGKLVRNVLLAVAALYVLASLYLLVDLHGRVAALEEKQTTMQAEFDKKIKSTQQTLSSELSERVGTTQKDIAQRTAELQREQRASVSRLSQEQKEQITQVSGEVSGVKTDVASTRTDLAATKTDLEATKMKLETAISDLGKQSGLIARTHDELEYLKHRGDKNYFEFTLKKNAQPTVISTVKLQLKKTDAKKGKFTLMVFADDNKIEKKDKTIFEPLQFFTGKDQQLYELVVNNLSKDTVSGYLATPKSIADPAAQ
jgi:uncharacterized small protein (DUF1192 family)